MSNGEPREVRGCERRPGPPPDHLVTGQGSQEQKTATFELIDGPRLQEIATLMCVTALGANASLRAGKMDVATFFELAAGILAIERFAVSIRGRAGPLALNRGASPSRG